MDEKIYQRTDILSGEHYDPMREPRFTGLPTFMRAPFAESLEGLDIALIGVPTDIGVTNRPGARHGPREIRNASSLMRAFTQARDVCYKDLSETLEGTKYTVPWLDAHVSEIRRQLGADFWPYGLKRNQPTIETYIRYLHQQHFLERPIAAEELFAANALE